MKDNTEHIEKIERYIEDSMSFDERVAFEKELLLNEGLKDELEAYKLIIEGVRQDSQEEELKEFLKGVDKRIELPLKKEYKMPINWQVIVAASIAIAIGMFWFASSNKQNRIADQFYFPDSGFPVYMSQEADMNVLMNAFKTGDYQSAAAIVSELKENDPQNDTILYYSGVIAYELEDYDAAIRHFKNVMTPSEFREKADFRFILACLKNESYNTVEEELSRLLNNKNHSFHQEFVSIQDAISE